MTGTTSDLRRTFGVATLAGCLLPVAACAREDCDAEAQAAIDTWITTHPCRAAPPSEQEPVGMGFRLVEPDAPPDSDVR